MELRGIGLKVMYTELDINLLPNTPRGADPAVANPYANGLPDEVQLASRYAEGFLPVPRRQRRDLGLDLQRVRLLRAG